jgi:hypothetical protein
MGECTERERFNVQQGSREMKIIIGDVIVPLDAFILSEGSQPPIVVLLFLPSGGLVDFPVLCHAAL